MSNCGEFFLESSRAFPDDEDDDGTSQESITFQATPNTEKIITELKNTRDGSLYVFEGKIACGFATGFLDERQFQLFGYVNYGGFDGTVDSLLNRRQRPIVKLYFGPQNLVFALVDTYYGLPRASSNDIVDAVSFIMNLSSNVTIFYSEPLVGFRGEGDVQGKLFHLKSSAAQLHSSIGASITVLPQPNIVCGVSAAVLTHCEAKRQSCFLLVTYCETETVDSISTKPFFYGSQQISYIQGTFSKLTFNAGRSTKANFTPVRNSNLYT